MMIDTFVSMHMLCKQSSHYQVVEEPRVEDRRLRRLREAQESSLSRYMPPVLLRMPLTRCDTH